MLTLTSPVETWMHRPKAGVKLALLCGVTLVLFRLDGAAAQGLALGLVALLAATGGGRFLLGWLRLLRALWPFALVIALWHGWTGDIAGGAAILLRLVAAVGAANLVTMTTRLSDMIAVMERLARPLAPLLPPRRLALAIALVIRFIPVLSERVAVIRDAWAARSPRRAGWRILLPATLAALDEADHVAEALRARGGAG
ncbi:MAG: hypothetical protein RIR62_2110 [Pseudomonadota bacterium]